MEQKKGVRRTSKIGTALKIGTVGGTLWSFLGYVAYIFKFTKIGPSIFISPFVAEDFSQTFWGQISGIAVAVMLSILFSLLYVYTLSKFYYPWIGAACGLGLFAVFYYVLNPIFSLTKKPIHALGMNTFSTQLCLFILVGLFIGSSLSIEFSSKEPPTKAK